MHLFWKQRESDDDNDDEASYDRSQIPWNSPKTRRNDWKINVNGNHSIFLFCWWRWRGEPHDYSWGHHLHNNRSTMIIPVSLTKETSPPSHRLSKPNIPWHYHHLHSFHNSSTISLLLTITLTSLILNLVSVVFMSLLKCRIIITVTDVVRVEGEVKNIKDTFVKNVQIIVCSSLNFFHLTFDTHFIAITDSAMKIFALAILFSVLAISTAIFPIALHHGHHLGHHGYGHHGYGHHGYGHHGHHAIHVYHAPLHYG